jgi:hypothetical protein
MRKQYLHLSAKCDGPVVAGLLAVRENEISKETEIRQVGAICLSCGYQHGQPMPLVLAVSFHPYSGNPRKALTRRYLQLHFRKCSSPPPDNQAFEVENEPRRRFHE